MHSSGSRYGYGYLIYIHTEHLNLDIRYPKFGRINVLVDKCIHLTIDLVYRYRC